MNFANGTGPTGFAVLLADADPASVTPIHQTLEALCLLDQLMVVRDGREALAYLHGEGEFDDRLTHPFPNLMFMECRLPSLSGLSVLCLLRSAPRFEHLPVVMLSRGFSRTQCEMLTGLRAASCEAKDSPERMLDAITRSIRLAVGSQSGMSLDGPTVSRAGTAVETVGVMIV